MIALLLLATTLSAVRPEPVGERARSTALSSRPSTSSGRAAGKEVIAAERAFAAMAQAKGQWTAFRAYAAPDATMFVPQPVKAQEWLKDRKDPPVAVTWSPTAVYLSCDGGTAVSTGEWHASYGHGFFSTVWRRERNGDWRWLVDGGDALAKPRGATNRPVVRQAVCANTAPHIFYAPTGVRSSTAQSPDGSLTWSWTVSAEGKRTFEAQLWTGRQLEKVISDDIPVPPITPPPPPARAKP